MSSASVCVYCQVSISSIVMVDIFFACKLANYGDRKEAVYLKIHIHTQVKIIYMYIISFRSFVAAYSRSVSALHLE